MRSALLAILLCVETYVAAGSEVLAKEGPITLTHSDKDFVLKAGTEITMELPLYMDDSFKPMSINACGRLRNTTGKSLQIIYVVSFYDKDSRLVAAASGNCRLAPKEQTWWGSAVVKGKEEEFQQVTSYKLNAFTFDLPPEKQARHETSG